MIKIVKSLLLLTAVGAVFAENKRLSFEDVQGKSPFEYASLGFISWYPNENAYLVKRKGQILKITVPDLDTTVFLTPKDFVISGKNILGSKNLNKEAPWVQTISQNIDDLLKTSTFWLSKDGSMILLAYEKEKIWRRSFFATYYYMDLKTKEIFPLSNENSKIRNAKFSPDGKKVAYVREDNNLYVFDLDRKKERQLTRTGSEAILNGHFGWVYEEEFGSFDAYRWSPDSEKIAFWQEDQSAVSTFLMFDEMSLYPTVEKIRYPKAGEKNPKMSIFNVNIKRGKPKKIDLGETEDIYFPWMEWSDSDNLVLMKMNRLQNDYKFLKIFANGKKVDEGVSEKDPNGWVQLHRNYHFLENGNLLWMSERDGWHHIYLHTFKGKLIKQITSGNWEVKKIVAVDEKNEKVYFMANKKSVFENRFYSIGFNGKDLTLLTKEPGSHSVKLFPDYSGFLDTYSNLNTPSRHLLKDIEGNLIKVISETDKSQFEEYDWSYPEIIKFQTDDNSTALDGIITYPPNFKKGKRYPVIVHGYGMPGTQIVYNRWGSTWNQFLAHQGYIVFSLDARGMSGRGEEFKNLSYGDMSKYLSRDTAAGVKHLISIGIADPEKIGAWGWSGGGYFTGLMLTKNADLFDVGVSVAPVMDFRLYDSIYTERSMGLPKDNKSGYDSTSVLSYVDRFKGKLLVIHGTGDDNVHSQNTTWLVEEFVKHDKQLDVFYYPNRPHGMSGGNARKNLYMKMITYFNENLKGKPLVRKTN